MDGKKGIGLVIAVLGIIIFGLGAFFCLTLLELSPHFRGILATYDLIAGTNTLYDHMSKLDMLVLLSLVLPIAGTITTVLGLVIAIKE